MAKLSEVQGDVLRALAKWRQEQGEFPSLQDLATRRSCTRRAVVKVLKALERKRFLKRRDRKDFEILPLGLAWLEENL